MTTAIDSLLSILVQQDGTALTLTSNRRPQMFKGDDELSLTMPAMSAEHIRAILGDLWTTNQARLRDSRELRLEYDSPDLGAFTVTLAQPSEGEILASFRRDKGLYRRDPAAARTNDADPPSAAPPAIIDADGSGLSPSLIALLVRAAARGASDIHLSPRRPPVVRVNTGLQVLDGAATPDASELLGNDAERRQLEAGVSVDRALDIPSVGRVRVNVYATDDGICAAIRILHTEVPSLADLRLPGQLEPLVHLPHGLVIACGPTGSGKSTTLAALVQHALQARPRVVVTLEDPIEYLIRPARAAGVVRQRQVGTHVRDFATGLRDALREDPDILLIGEMRDRETIGLALTAAETGHLVFASLHSRTSTSAVERIVDTYPAERQRQVRVQLADSLRAVISQHLIPTADGNSRVAAVEVLRVTYAVANLIREGRTAQIVNAIQAGSPDGMVVLERSLADLVRTKRISREAAMAVAADPVTLEEYLRSAGVS